MHNYHWGHRIIFSAAITGLLIFSHSQAEPPAIVTQILSVQPEQKGVAVAMPSTDELEKCTVVGDPNAKPGQTVWVLKDGKGTILRRFVDTNQDNRPDVFGYYKDGIEVYREIDSKYSGRKDKFIWLGGGGSKIGLSKNGSGVIDTWQAISLEEVSQEVLQAVATKNWDRYAALLVNDEDLQTLGISAADAERIKKSVSTASGKFQQVLGKFSLNGNSKWLHAETSGPSRLLAESTGWKRDVIVHARVMILCETAGKTEYIQLGEVVQVGEAWKLVDAPMSIDMPLVAGVILNQGAKEAAVEDGPLQKVMSELADLDAKAPQETGSGVNVKMVEYHAKRAEVMNRIIPICPQKDRENWYKQIIDSLSAAVSASKADDPAAYQLFQNYVSQIIKQAPGSEIASYGQYRLLIVENNRELATNLKKAEDHLKVQKSFADRLVNFVNSYPNGSDAPEAMHRLGEVYELIGQENEASKWFQAVAQKYPNSKQAGKATGAVRRLSSIGQTWTVGANAVLFSANGQSQPWNAAGLAKRPVIIYYWATWADSSAADFAKMKQIMQGQQANGAVLVAVNLDDKLADAQAFLQKNAANMPQGFHLHCPGSFESPAAVYYGLNVFPAMFLQDANGKIVSRTLDVTTLEEELKKLK
jgi:TolA-binding protein